MQAIYLDMDTLWMDSPKRLWEEFQRMSEGKTLFAMALETTDMNADGSWYRGGDNLVMPFTPKFVSEEKYRMVCYIVRVTSVSCCELPSTPCKTRETVFSGHSRGLPFYGDFGLNAGVLLLNLKALRASGFSVERDKIIRHFLPKKALPLGDQDVLNAYASKYPGRVQVMSCLFNFRSDSACYSGFPVILHGNRNLKKVMNSTYRSLFFMFGKFSMSHALNYA